MRRSLSVLGVLSVLALASHAHAAPNDCIRDGGQMICTDPIITAENIVLCDETGPYAYRSNMAAACGWGQPTPTVGSAISKMSCFEAGLSGCSSSPQWPGWSVPGQSHTSNFCWNITTTLRNGIIINEFARVTRTTTYRDPETGNCSVTGGFTAPITAWKVRTLECPPGYNTATYPNGDYKCFQCPANSTWNGANCVCNAGYVKDLHTGVCIEACNSDEQCDDRDFCNGEEACIAGYCLSTRAPTCRDNRVCTLDRCDPSLNACVNELDPSLCRCEQVGNIKAEASANLKFTPGRELTCPFFIGGKAGVTLAVKPAFEKTFATCANACQGSSSAELEVSAELKACTKPATLTAKAKYTNKTRHCLTCTDSCSAQCSDPSCDTDTLSGSLKQSFEPEIKGLKREFKLGSFGYGITCVAKYFANVGTNLEYEGTGPVGGFQAGPGCAPCTDCQTFSSRLSGGGGFKGSCELKGLPPDNPKKPGSGCIACFEGSVSLSGGSKGQWGNCGTNSCSGLRLDGESKAEAPTVSLQYGWFKVTGSCKSVVKGCAEATDCGTCACKNCGNIDWDSSSCSVKFGAAAEKGGK